MSNAKKPVVKRAPSTRRSQDEKQKALNQGLRVTFEGRVYEVRYGDVTPALARELRANTGMGWNQLMSMLMVDPDIDLMQSFLWLARRLQGERVQLDGVDVSYEDVIDIVEEDGIEGLDGEGEPDPET